MLTSLAFVVQITVVERSGFDISGGNQFIKSRACVLSSAILPVDGYVQSLSVSFSAVIQ